MCMLVCDCVHMNVGALRGQNKVWDSPWTCVTGDCEPCEPCDKDAWDIYRPFERSVWDLNCHLYSPPPPLSIYIHTHILDRVHYEL